MRRTPLLRPVVALLLALWVGLAAGPASAQPLEGEIVRVTLISGDVLTGVLVERVGEGVVLDHPTLGRISLPSANVRAITALTAEGEEKEAPPEEVAEEPIAPRPPPWQIRLELGANGSSGNTDRDSFRFSTLATRETGSRKVDLSLIYRYAQEDDVKTENQLFVRARHAWKFTESPRWSLFVEGTYETDDFQDWTDRFTGFVGVGYRFIDLPNETLDGRVGLGGTQRWGSEDDSFDTQVQFAADYRRQFNDRIAFLASAEFLPAVDDFFDDYRLRGTADLEVKLRDDGAWLLKVGVEDKYDATPGAAEHNDFYYGVSLVMAF